MQPTRCIGALLVSLCHVPRDSLPYDASTAHEVVQALYNPWVCDRWNNDALWLQHACYKISSRITTSRLNTKWKRNNCSWFANSHDWFLTKSPAAQGLCHQATTMSNICQPASSLMCKAQPLPSTAPLRPPHTHVQ